MSDILENLIQSKVKRKLLKLFLFNKNKKYHTRELSRTIEEPISAVQRELKKLLKLQIIIKYPEGNLINYFANTQNPFFEEIKDLILKTTTEPKDFFKLLMNTKSLEVIAIFGDTVKNPMKYDDPINLLIIGSLSIEILHEYLKAIMDIFKREYNLLYYSPLDYNILKSEDKKLQQILSSKNIIYIKGTSS